MLQFRMFPVAIRQNINNSQTSIVHGNPMKDINAASDGEFENNRQQFAKTWSYYQANTMDVQREKKWGDSFGGNRDASSVVDRRRQRAMQPTFNTKEGETYCTVSNREENSRKTALTRVRAGGASVPAKCRHRIDSVGAPAVPQSVFSKAVLIRSAQRLPYIPLGMNSKPLA